MAEYYEESPEITKRIDWDTIFNRAPMSNIGMVPIEYRERLQLPFLSNTPPTVPGRGIKSPKGSVPETWKTHAGYVSPSDKRANLGSMSAEEFNELYPYEHDYSGIMAAKALQESGDPIFDISRMDPRADVSNIPPSMRTDAEYIRPGSEKRYGATSTWPPPDAPTKFAVGLNIPSLREEKGYIDSTLLHEARHYYQSKYGFDITQLSDDEMHNVIYQFQGMYNNPIDRRSVTPSRDSDWTTYSSFIDPERKKKFAGILNKKEADAYMAMVNQGRDWYQNQGQGFGQSKAEKVQYEKDLEKRGDDYHWLMMAGQKSLGNTHEQSMKQFDRMYDYDTSQRRGDYTRPTMTQQQMVREAQETGGRVNPHEATRASYQEPTPDRTQGPARHHFNQGGIAGLAGQWTPSMAESEDEEYNIRPIQLDPGIMSIEDLADLFEEAGLDKSIIYKFINSGGLSQLIS